MTDQRTRDQQGGDKQTSQGQTLQRSMEQGRDASSRGWGQPGFKPPTEPQSFKWEGDIESAPDWIDRGWAGYDAGPALNVPKGDPSQAPYTTQVVRTGDTLTYTPGPGGAFGGFAVQRAEQTGGQPGPEYNTAPGESPTFRPPAQTEADLNDLVRTGMVKPEDMDPDARAQWAARLNQKGAGTAEALGHIPSDEGQDPSQQPYPQQSQQPPQE